jgi:hypothetical protein
VGFVALEHRDPDRKASDNARRLFKHSVTLQQEQQRDHDHARESE